MRLVKNILAVVLLASVCSFAAQAAMTVDELHVGGSVDVRLICNPDSAGHVVYNSQTAIDVKRAGNALYIVAQAATSPVARVAVTVYTGGHVKIIEASGRARLTADSLRSADMLSLVASGASVMTLTDIAAANVNVSLSGSGSIVISGALTASTLNLSLVGSGTVKADAITASRMTVSQRGSGKMFFSGSARDCDVVGRGTGAIDLRALVAGSMDLKLYGQGRIFYPAGVRVTMDGNTDRILQVNPYQPL